MREHQELVFISTNGMVQRTAARGINRYGRASQGVRVMNVRDDDRVSAVALVDGVRGRHRRGRRGRRRRSVDGDWPDSDGTDVEETDEA